MQTGFEGLYDAVFDAIKNAIQKQKLLSKKHLEETQQESAKHMRLLAAKEQTISKLQKELKKEVDERRKVENEISFF